MRLLRLFVVIGLVGSLYASTAQSQDAEWGLLNDSLGVTAWHQAGYVGTGVKVGIIDVGFGSITTLTDQAIFPPESDLTEINASSILHGTWVYEVLAHIAPQATYYLFPLNAGGRNLAQAVDWMIANGVQVVNYSASTVDIPLDGTNYQAQQMGRMADANIVVVTSAGNQGVSYIADTFRDHNNDGWHEFAGGYATLWANPLITARFGETHLRWEDVYTSAQIDLDLYILGGNGDALLDASTDVQKGRSADWPYEDAFYPMTAGIPFYIGVRAKHVGTIPEGTPFYIYADHAQLSQEYITWQGSITAPSDSPKVLAVGAIESDQQLWWRSSHGPTWDGRIKPDVVAPTRLTITSSTAPFTGTSASSPIVAGLMVLIRERLPTLTETEARQWLLNYAQDLGETGPDNLYGYGVVWLPAPTE